MPYGRLYQIIDDCASPHFLLYYEGHELAAYRMGDDSRLCKRWAANGY